MTKVISNLNSSNHNNGHDKAISTSRHGNGSVISNSGSRNSVNQHPHYDHPLKVREGAALKKSVIHAQEEGQGSVQDDAPEVTLTQEEMDEIREVKRMAQDDTNRVNRWRITVTVVLLITAFCVTYTTYRLLKSEETGNFETAFEQFSRTVEAAAINQQLDLREGLNTLATAIAIYADTNARNETWPFITLPRFQSTAQNALEQANMETINFLPRVEGNQRHNWIQYANAHHQQWVEEGHLLQKGNLNRLVGGEETYHPFVSSRNRDGTFHNETENDFYFVSWQYSPPPATYDLINGNLFSVPQFAVVAEALLRLGSETLITNVFPHVGIPTAMTREEHNKLHSELLDTRSENPHSFVVHPVHRALPPGQPLDTPREIMAILAGAFAWDVALLHLLPEGVVGMHAVIRNNCNQSYTYEIRGKDAYFLGNDDLHETKYNHMEVLVNLALHTHPDFAATPGHCQYEMHIYPSDEFRNSYDSNTPEIFAAVVATTFGIVALVTFLHDLFVERRNHNLIVKAAQTNAIVYSLFPKLDENLDEEVGAALTREETDTNTAATSAPSHMGVASLPKGEQQYV